MNNGVLLTNLIQLLSQYQPAPPPAKESSVPMYIILLIIGAVISLGMFWIKKQISDNSDTTKNSFIDLKIALKDLDIKIDDVKDNNHSIQLEMSDAYLKTKRFETHELKYDRAVERIHRRIDGIEGAPPRVKDKD